MPATKYCRQPSCDHESKDLDHIKEFQDGGPTTLENGQGLCKKSHQIKSQPGWHLTPDTTGIQWKTPTGHTYHSPTPPVLPKDQD